MSYGRLTRFLLPLAITSIVVELGSQFLSAGMARAPQATQTLAAYGLGWGLVLLITSPLSQVRELGLVLVGTPQSLRQARRFVVALGVCMTAVLASLTLTPVGDAVIERLHGIDAELGQVVRTALLLLIPYPLLTGFARFHTGLLLRGRRTVLVSYATLTNLAVSVVTVLILLHPDFIQRRPILLPVIVTYAGLLCELTIVTWGAYHYRDRWLVTAPPLPGAPAHVLTLAAILRFFWPLALIMLVQELSRPVINLFVARGPDATAALAILAILYTLGRIPYGWLNDLRNLASAFRGERHSLHYIRNFVIACAGVSFAMFVLLFWTPLRSVILEQWIGVEAELAARGTVPLVLYSLFSVVVAARAWFHGLGLVERRTPAMAPSAPARLAAIILTLVLLPYLGVYGATLGVMALFMGFLVETITVWWGIRGRRWLAARRAVTTAA